MRIVPAASHVPDAGADMRYDGCAPLEPRRHECSGRSDEHAGARRQRLAPRRARDASLCRPLV